MCHADAYREFDGEVVVGGVDIEGNGVVLQVQAGSVDYAAKIQAEITRTRGEAEAKAKFLVENEKALGAKRRADVFMDAGTLADLQFVDSLSPNLSIRVLHSGEGTLWTDLKGSSLALPSASEKK